MEAYGVTVAQKFLVLPVRVQIPVGLPNARVAQLVRAPGLHPGGRRFESCSLYHFFIIVFDNGGSLTYNSYYIKYQNRRMYEYDYRNDKTNTNGQLTGIDSRTDQDYSSGRG